MNQTITNLNDEQVNIINEFTEIGMDILAHYSVDENKTIYENLDQTYEKWLNDQNDKPSEQLITIGVGAVFGNRLLKKYSTKWQFLKDEYGEEFMIDIKGNRICPIDFVGKRVYGDGLEKNFFSSFMEKKIETKSN